MTKRKTEAQKKAALLQRVRDIYAGASGTYLPDDEYCLAETIRRVMCAVRSLWTDKDKNTHLIGCWNVDEYETIEKATDFLYRSGVRA